jgi:hypothetical protein
MHSPQAPDLTGQQLTLGKSNVATVAAVVGLAALAFGGILGVVQQDGLRYFFHSYLTSFCFYLSIALGGLFFTALHHVTRAGWSVSVRRLAEIFAMTVGLMAVLFLPIIVPMLTGSHSLYEWTNPEAVAASEALQHKSPYLNVHFFAVRAVFYFFVWWNMAKFFFRRSVHQDSGGGPELTLQMERWSGPSIFLFAITVTFASFDWLMSLDPLWFSTIFGVYYFAGIAVGFLAAAILAAVLLQSSGRLQDTITVEHYHDLGKLLFGFVIFWGYIAFSQYMLIWYGNIPEETVWYLRRQQGPWTAISLLLLFGHLVIPFLGLLPRFVKRTPKLLAFWAVWLLVFHWLDMYYLVMPNVGGERLPLGLLDASLLVGMGGIYLAGWFWFAADRALVPLHDPRLAESLAFENV